MKFGKQLEAQSVPGWEDSYIDYKGLKRVLKVRCSDVSLLRCSL